MRDAFFMRNIVFLTHMARSGSTLVARELDRFREVAVGIEETVPDGMVRGEEVVLHNFRDLEDYMNRAWQDPKLRDWGIQREELKKSLADKHTFPIRFPEILGEMLLLYFAHDPAVHLVHKKGPYYLYVDRLRQWFPKARFIHVDRDPRGIYNSQKRARRSDTGEVMAEPLTTFAFQYLAAEAAIRKHQKAPYFHLVVYEQFLKDPQREVARIIDFLGADSRAVSRDDNREEQRYGAYVGKIPGAQHHLHEHLKGDVLPGRATSWKEELGAEELYFLQKALPITLRSKGYEQVSVHLVSPAAKVRVWRKVFWFYIRYGLKRLFFVFNLANLVGSKSGKKVL